MNTDELKNTANDIKDKTEDLFESAKESTEDMVKETKQDINRKGGEVKGRADQWQDDHRSDQDDRTTASEANLDNNPLGSDHSDHDSDIDES